MGERDFIADRMVLPLVTAHLGGGACASRFFFPAEPAFESWERACPAMTSCQATALSRLTSSRGKPAPTISASGKHEILAHRLDHFPGAFHPRFDHEHIPCLQVLGLFTFRGDDAVAIEEG